MKREYRSGHTPGEVDIIDGWRQAEQDSSIQSDVRSLFMLINVTTVGDS